MPNHVTNKIEFRATKEQAATIYAAISTNEQLDFNRLIPAPIYVYQGSLNLKDEDDFGDFAWYPWNKLHWGTKWNAISSRLDYGDGLASITFDTAWSVPYPVIVAFGNTFQIPFTLKYYDEGSLFWGIETYDVTDFHAIERTSCRKSDDADKAQLCLELEGYAPDDDTEEDV